MDGYTPLQRTTVAALWTCDRCGAIVTDTGSHDTWHALVVTELVRVAVEAALAAIVRD